MCMWSVKEAWDDLVSLYKFFFGRVRLIFPQVMMMQQSGAMVGGAGGIASPFVSNSAAGVGGGGGFVGSTSPPLMRPQVCM